MQPGERLGIAEQSDDPLKLKISFTTTPNKNERIEQPTGTESVVKHKKDGNNHNEITTRHLYLVLCELHKELVRRDPRGIFANPVTDDIAIGYSEVIKHPMDLGTIYNRLHTRTHYLSAAEYLSDVTLMCNNAMIYNPPDTIYFQKARKLLIFCQKQLQPSGVAKLCTQLGIRFGLTPSELGRINPLPALIEHQQRRGRHSSTQQQPLNATLVNSPTLSTQTSESLRRRRPSSSSSSSSTAHSSSALSDKSRRRSALSNVTEACLIDMTTNDVSTPIRQSSRDQKPSLAAVTISTNIKRKPGRPPKLQRKLTSPQFAPSASSSSPPPPIRTPPPLLPSLIQQSPHQSPADVSPAIPQQQPEQDADCSPIVQSPTAPILPPPIDTSPRLAQEPLVVLTTLPQSPDQEQPIASPIESPPTPIKQRRSSSPLHPRRQGLKRRKSKLAVEDQQPIKRSRPIKRVTIKHNRSRPSVGKKKKPSQRQPDPDDLVTARQALEDVKVRLTQKYTSQPRQDQRLIGPRIVCLERTESGQLTATECVKARSCCPGDQPTDQSQAEKDDNLYEAFTSRSVNYPQPVTNALAPTGGIDSKSSPAQKPSLIELTEPLTLLETGIFAQLHQLQTGEGEALAANIHNPMSIFSNTDLALLSSTYGPDSSCIDYALSLLNFVQPVGRLARQWAGNRLERATDGAHSKAISKHGVGPLSEGGGVNSRWTDKAGFTIDSPSPAASPVSNSSGDSSEPFSFLRQLGVSMDTCSLEPIHQSTQQDKSESQPIAIRNQNNEHNSSPVAKLYEHESSPASIDAKISPSNSCQDSTEMSSSNICMQEPKQSVAPVDGGNENAIESNISSRGFSGIDQPAQNDNTAEEQKGSSEACVSSHKHKVPADNNSGNNHVSSLMPLLKSALCQAIDQPSDTKHINSSPDPPSHQLTTLSNCKAKLMTATDASLLVQYECCEQLINEVDSRSIQPYFDNLQSTEHFSLACIDPVSLSYTCLSKNEELSNQTSPIPSPASPTNVAPLIEPDVFDKVSQLFVSTNSPPRVDQKLSDPSTTTDPSS